MTLPLSINDDESNNPVIESLNVDFWKFEVKNKGKHEPKEWGTNKNLVFSLRKLFKQANNQKPTFFFYLGSKTTPPCKGIKIYYH